ncbi:MAG TPA: response regulator [Syntrophales bacterium]|jgi:DNA-binding NarL/FixJ family response regulator|nr:response regulator [Syntrophales bacterium]HON22450.1 response regulator [Syntrophales bacterium]HOU78561.1 response regulator [Syntrophales bacterium]HPC33667.1 response regulator [Syntrophales bacterium]HQG35179.1 response regulator [Syntrophales bacterium]
MADTLDVIILDDDKMVCELIADLVKNFYTWGDVFAFTDFDQAVKHCLQREVGVAIFIVDVYLSGKNAFSFLDAIADKFPMAFEDTIIITGNASDDIVNICLASDINYLLEKPVRPYALQLAVRAIVSKYLYFVKKLHMNPELIESLSKFQP